MLISQASHLFFAHDRKTDLMSVFPHFKKNEKLRYPITLKKDQL